MGLSFITGWIDLLHSWTAFKIKYSNVTLPLFFLRHRTISDGVKWNIYICPLLVDAFAAVVYSDFLSWSSNVNLIAAAPNLRSLFSILYLGIQKAINITRNGFLFSSDFCLLLLTLACIANFSYLEVLHTLLYMQQRYMAPVGMAEGGGSIVDDYGLWCRPRCTFNVS